VGVDVLVGAVVDCSLVSPGAEELQPASPTTTAPPSVWSALRRVWFDSLVTTVAVVTPP
jgi:hypothetical protein